MLQLTARSQYYLTGEVLDVHGDKLQNVSISSHSTGLTYLTGISGEFRILSRSILDTLTFAIDGYQAYTTEVNSGGYMSVTLKMNEFLADGDDRRPVSLIRVPDWDSSTTALVAGVGLGAGGGVSGGASELPRVGRREFRGRVENPFVPQWATICFTGAVRRESYSTIRRFLDMGSEVPADAVKIEEMLNYFNFAYDPPGARDIFTCASQVMTCPWNAAHRLLALRVCSRKVDIRSRPPANLVLLIDASGSMDMPNKLPLVKAGIRLLVDNLRDIDTISLVEFGRQVRVLFAGMPGSEKTRILRAVEGLRADGPSPGLQGLQLAYAVAKQQFIPGGNNRVILLTDGDVSMEPPAAEQDLVDLVSQQSQAGIRLTCGGLGMKSVKDSRLPRLAEIGRGDFAYLDDENIVEQMLVQELDPRLATVASNVSMSVEFSPALAGQYRLIGYNNKRNALADTPGILEGGRVGSGSSEIALFEYAPKRDTTGADTLARIKVSYVLPGQTSAKQQYFDCMDGVVPLERAEPEWRRMVCLALFGMKLRRSDNAGTVGWPDLEKMAKRIFTGNNYLDDEYISLIDRAKRIYEKSRFP